MWLVSCDYLQRTLMLAGHAQIFAVLLELPRVDAAHSFTVTVRQCTCTTVHALSLRFGAALLLITFWTTKVHMLPREI
jgi:hypothetical protein